VGLLLRCRLLRAADSALDTSLTYLHCHPQLHLDTVMHLNRVLIQEVGLVKIRGLLEALPSAPLPDTLDVSETLAWKKPVSSAQAAQA
jgi:hypothetical protein